MKPGSVVRLCKADPTFECAYIGKQAKIQRIENLTAYVELSCGHPYSAPLDYFILDSEEAQKQISIVPSILAAAANFAAEIAARVGNETLIETKAENNMLDVQAQQNQSIQQPQLIQQNQPAKQAQSAPQEQYIADAKGIVRVKSTDTLVDGFKTDLKTYKRLEQAIKQGKATFRSIANKVLDLAVGGVKAIECYASNGEFVKVSVPDFTKDGNRTNLSSDTISALNMLGYEFDDLLPGIVEKSESYELTGDFVTFMDQLIADNYTSKGIEIPEGVKKKANYKLTTYGVETMLALRKSKREHMGKEYALANVLLEGGLKDGTVS